MDIIRRNLLTLLKSGALNEYGNIEPMSSLKWQWYIMFHLLFIKD